MQSAGRSPFVPLGAFRGRPIQGSVSTTRVVTLVGRRSDYSFDQGRNCLLRPAPLPRATPRRTRAEVRRVETRHLSAFVERL